MQLLRLKLENWRAVQSREIALEAGVNIVEGANEAGKSSFIEALNYLINERDSTKKKELKSVAPKGNDVGSSVEVELKTAGYHLTYCKTFNKRPATSLLMHAPDILQFTGLEAHDKVLSILEETIDVALWQALQLEQGSEFVEINLRQSRGLARALDSAVGGVGGSSKDDSLIVERARKEYLKYYTERTARETNELAAARAQADEVRDAIAQATCAMQGMQAKVDYCASLSETIREQRALIPELKSKLKDFQLQKVALDTLHNNKRLVKSQCNTLNLKIAELKQQQKQRLENKKQLTEQHDALIAAKTQLDDLGSKQEELRHQLRGLTQKRDPLLDRRKAVDEQIRALSETLQSQSDLQELTATETRYQYYTDAQDQLEICQQEMQQLLVDDDALSAIEALQQRQRDLEVRLSAAKPVLTITAIRDEVVGDTKVPAGESVNPDTSNSFELVIGDSAAVSFTPATDLDELTIGLTKIKAESGSLMQRYAVKSVAEAVQVHRRRVELQQQVINHKKRCDEVSQGDVLQLQQRLQLLRGQNLEQLAVENVGDINQQLSERRNELDEIDLQLKSLNTERETLQQESAGIVVKIEHVNESIAGHDKSIADHSARIDAILEQVPDEYLLTTINEEQQALVVLQSELQEIEKTLNRDAAVDTERQVEVATQAFERANKELHNDEKELAAVNAQLDQLKAEGLHEKIERLLAEQSDIEEQLGQLVRSAVAAKCLWETLVKHQIATQRSYAKPLSECVGKMGRFVFGEDFSVQLNESLVIESRTLGGITVPFRDLSGGVKEQLGILVRLAATQLVTGLPLILDDTLGHTDADRLQTMGSLLSTAGRQTQIVVMTCYPQRYRHVGDATVHRLQASQLDQLKQSTV